MSLVLKLAWVVYHLDSLCQPCFRKPWLLSTCVYHANTSNSVRDASARSDRSAGDSGRVHRTSACCVIRGTRVSVGKIEGSIEADCQASWETAQNPNGGPYPVCASDKSWNEASRGLQQVEEGPAQENAIDAASSFLRGNTTARLLLRVRSLAVRELPCQALCGAETTLVLTCCSRLWCCRTSSLGATRILC